MTRSCLWHADCDAADRALHPWVAPSHPPMNPPTTDEWFDALVGPSTPAEREARASIALDGETHDAEAAEPGCNCRTHRHEMGIPCPTHDAPLERGSCGKP